MYVLKVKNNLILNIKYPTFYLLSYARVSQVEHFQSVYNYNRLPHEVLTVKDNKDQYQNYRWSKGGLQIFCNIIITKATITKPITKATITKLFGLHHLQLVRNGQASGWADKKVDISTFSTSTFLIHC